MNQYYTVTANSTIALALSLAVGWLWLRIEFAAAWIWPVTAMMGILAINAVIAWFQVQKMLEFQSHRP